MRLRSRHSLEVRTGSILTALVPSPLPASEPLAPAASNVVPPARVAMTGGPMTSFRSRGAAGAVGLPGGFAVAEMGRSARPHPAPVPEGASPAGEAAARARPARPAGACPRGGSRTSGLYCHQTPRGPPRLRPAGARRLPRGRRSSPRGRPRRARGGSRGTAPTPRRSSSPRPSRTTCTAAPRRSRPSSATCGCSRPLEPISSARSLAGWYFKGMPDAARWRNAAMSCETAEEFLSVAAEVRAHVC